MRAKNILEKAEKELGYIFNAIPLAEISKYSLEFSSYDINLLQVLLRFEEAINLTLQQAKPHHLANYAYELATIFSGFYVHSPKLLEEKNNDILQVRLALVGLTEQTL